MRLPANASAATVNIEVQKEEHKFSCAHMTIFTDGTKERLHGHNFHVGASVQLPARPGRPMLDIARIKQVIASICSELREHLLLPAASAHVRIVHRDDLNIECEVCGKRYALPSEDVVLLPVDNVVVEALAAYVWGRIAEALRHDLDEAGALSLQVTVTESEGQGASHRQPLA
jgi:6-pyruvoyltetrahydropterin/6-carboxytetrahydropterin synthase